MEKIKAGYSRVCFSPDKPVNMNSTKIGETVYEDIYTTALYLEQGEIRTLVIHMDVRNVYTYFSNTVRPMITEATGVPTENIFLHTPHNHSSPDCSAENNATVIDWRERIGFPAIVKAAVEAVADAKEIVSMEGAEKLAPQVSFVRRYLMEDGNWCAIGNPSKVPKVAHESDADRMLRAVRIRRESGKDIVLVSYQTHAAGALGARPTEINADFVGSLRDTVEADGTCLAMYLQGACGDVNNSTRIQSEKHLVVPYEQVGVTLGKTALEALDNAKPMDFSRLQIMTTTLTCHTNHATDHLVEACRAIQEQNDPEVRRQMCEELGVCSFAEPGMIIRRSGFAPTEEMPLATLALGDLAFGFYPFEMFNRNGKQLRAASPFPMTFPCGYSLTYLGYMPDCTAVPHGGYEVFMCRYVPGTGESVVLKLAAMLQEMKNERG